MNAGVPLSVDEMAAGRRWTLLVAGGCVAVSVLGAPLALDGAAAEGWGWAARSLGGAGGVRALAGLLGRSSLLAPAGELAARVSLGAAGLAALAATLAFLAARRLADSPGGSAVVRGVSVAGGVASALLLLALGPLSVVAAASMAVVVLLALAGDAGERAPLAAFLLLGLALGLGAAPWLPLALLSAAAALVSLRRGQRWPLLAPAALALGALVLLAPSVADHAHGVAARGPAALWRALWVAGSLHAPPLHALGAHASILEARLGIPALLCALVGAVVLARRLAAVALVLLVGAATPLLVSDGGDAAALGISLGAVAVAAGVGVAAVARAVSGSTPVGALATAGALAAIVAAVAWLGPSWSRFAPPRPAGRWARAVLVEAPPRALLVVRARGAGPALRCEQEASGARPDVTVLRRDQLDDVDELVRAVDRGGGVALSPDELRSWRARGEQARTRDARWLVERALDRTLEERAVRWEAASSDEEPAPGDAPPEGTLVAGAPLLHVERPAALPPPPGVLAHRIADLTDGSGDPVARRLGADALTALAAMWLGSDPRRAAALLEAALRLDAGAARATLLLAEALARREELARAIALAGRVMASSPERVDARLAEARYRLMAGDLDGAAQGFGRAAALAPGAAAPRVGMAKVARARGALAEARSEVDRALVIDPSDGEARALLRELERR